MVENGFEKTRKKEERCDKKMAKLTEILKKKNLKLGNNK